MSSAGSAIEMTEVNLDESLLGAAADEGEEDGVGAPSNDTADDGGDNGGEQPAANDDDDEPSATMTGKDVSYMIHKTSNKTSRFRRERNVWILEAYVPANETHFHRQG